MTELTVREVVDALAEWGGASIGEADRLLAGEPATAVRGIAVAFTATIGAMQEAADSGASLLIVHEGAFYSHENDPAAWLACAAFYEEKRRRIARSGLAIYRCHDTLHRCHLDLITEGLIRELGWQRCVARHLPAASLIELSEPMTGEQVVRHVKQRLGLDRVRVAGNLPVNCLRIGLLVGYRGGGKLAIPLFDRYGADLVLYGEGPEWETPEYVRDLAEMGGRGAIVALGHLESEQPGMKLLTERLQALFPGVPVSFCPVAPALRSL